MKKSIARVHKAKGVCTKFNYYLNGANVPFCTLPACEIEYTVENPEGRVKVEATYCGSGSVADTAQKPEFSCEGICEPIILKEEFPQEEDTEELNNKNFEINKTEKQEENQKNLSNETANIHPDEEENNDTTSEFYDKI